VFPLFFLIGVLNSVRRTTRFLLPEEPAPPLDVRRDLLGYGTLAAVFSVVYIYFSVVLLNASQGGG
jgi:hypothetical protein